MLSLLNIKMNIVVVGYVVRRSSGSIVCVINKHKTLFGKFLPSSTSNMNVKDNSDEEETAEPCAT